MSKNKELSDRILADAILQKCSHHKRIYYSWITSTVGNNFGKYVRIYEHCTRNTEFRQFKNRMFLPGFRFETFANYRLLMNKIMGVDY